MCENIFLSKDFNYELYKVDQVVIDLLRFKIIFTTTYTYKYNL